MKQHIALCLQILVPAGASCLLHVVFQRIRYIIVDDQLNVWLIHTHAKSGGRHHHLHLVADKSILIRLFLGLVHLSIICKRGNAVIPQLLRKLHCALRPRHIHDRRAIFLFNQPTKRRVFLLIALFVEHLIPQVLPARTRSVERQIQAQFFLEILLDIADDFLLCRRGKARDRNPLCELFLLLQFPDKVTDV